MGAFPQDVILKASTKNIGLWRHDFVIKKGRCSVMARWITVVLVLAMAGFAMAKEQPGSLDKPA